LNCKYCHKNIEITLSGLRSFCSYECRKAHRRAYMADLMKSQRTVSKRGGYTNMDSADVSKSNPCHEPICEGQNDGLRLSEDYLEKFGGKSWYHLAKKHCCNFEVREKEGYCVMLFTQQRFKGKCCDCELGKALMKGN
jgi:hypothetical protein